MAPSVFPHRGNCCYPPRRRAGPPAPRPAPARPLAAARQRRPPAPRAALLPPEPPGRDELQLGAPRPPGPLLCYRSLKLSAGEGPRAVGVPAGHPWVLVPREALTAGDVYAVWVQGPGAAADAPSTSPSTTSVDPSPPSVRWTWPPGWEGRPPAAPCATGPGAAPPGSRATGAAGRLAPGGGGGGGAGPDPALEGPLDRGGPAVHGDGGAGPGPPPPPAPPLLPLPPPLRHRHRHRHRPGPPDPRPPPASAWTAQTCRPPGVSGCSQCRGRDWGCGGSRGPPAPSTWWSGPRWGPGGPRLAPLPPGPTAPSCQGRCARGPVPGAGPQPLPGGRGRPAHGGRRPLEG
ncbi:uncharacterized protein [Ciconia boyciana]|uniref:uncharacterized protein n=1 Tax=Ciconia boyciana TaxID=52775 RepID=UPI003BA2A9FF